MPWLLSARAAGSIEVERSADYRRCRHAVARYGFAVQERRKWSGVLESHRAVRPVASAYRKTSAC